MMTSDEMGKIEEKAEEAGIKPELMMENAGRSVAEVLSERMDIEDKRTAVVCGTGNNGGDGLCAARHLLSEGADVSVYVYGDPGEIDSREARANYRILEDLDVEVKSMEDESEMPQFDGFDVVIDSILGLGLEGELRGFLPKLVKRMNQADALKVAMDVPTGLNSDTGEAAGEVFEADLTVTFHDMKPGLKGDVCGDVVVESIGVPDSLEGKR